jgi:hypothetical protein
MACRWQAFQSGLEPHESEKSMDKGHLEDSMLRVKELLTREYEAHIAASRAKGRSEGRIEGQRSVLGKQLRLKFGPLPSGVETRLAQATGDQLDTWTERVLLASTLDEVLA